MSYDVIYCFEHIENMVSEEKKGTGEKERTHKDGEFDGMFQTCSVRFENGIEIVHNLVLHPLYSSQSIYPHPIPSADQKTIGMR